VGAADNQPKQGWLQVRASEHRRVDVSPEVIDAREWTGPCSGQSFRDTDPDQEAAGKAGAASHGDEIDVAGSHACAIEGHVKKMRQAFQVVPGGELRHHTAELSMQVDLRVDGVREYAPAVRNHGD